MMLVERAVGPQHVPPSTRKLSSLAPIDYADTFTLTTDVMAAPERWARAMFGNVPTAAEVLIWRDLLGLKLSQGSSTATVAGWTISGGGENWIRLEAASQFLSGNLVVETGPGWVSLGTYLRYDRFLGRFLWPPLSVIHRQLAPGLLRNAATRVAAGGHRLGSVR